MSFAALMQPDGIAGSSSRGPAVFIASARRAQPALSFALAPSAFESTFCVVQNLAQSPDGRATGSNWLSRRRRSKQARLLVNSGPSSPVHRRWHSAVNWMARYLIGWGKNNGERLDLNVVPAIVVLISGGGNFFAPPRISRNLDSSYACNTKVLATSG
jgi:hypothetical protein